MDNQIWKWFVIFALLFLSIETAIIRFKNEINEFLKLKKISGNHPETKIIDSTSPFHNKTVDILIVDGLIKIGISLPNTEHRSKIENLSFPRLV
jgi:hypothetical protein